MADEQACLVAARSDSDNSGFGACAMAYMENAGDSAAREPIDTSLNNLNSSGDSGELIDCSDRSALAQFHEEAIKQAGFGTSQLKVLLCVGLSVCGATVELAVVPFILPSAEIELCIENDEKSWLGMISLLGLLIGSAFWGKLADQTGRRRTLVSCLAVNAVFSTIAAFMPTYGTFMMARFCSAIGSGGVVPACFAYATELSRRQHRAWVASVWPLSVALGAVYAGCLAQAIVPRTGTETVIENKEHFSAWHRYLLLCTLPLLASLVRLLWTNESPRYLLEAGREVEALQIYQSIHRRNESRACGSAAAVSAGSDYKLNELQPAKRPQRDKRANHTRALSFIHDYVQLFSNQFSATTVTLLGALLFITCVHSAIAAYVPSTVVQMEVAQFDSRRVIIANGTFVNLYHNTTIENVDYVNSTFRNCSFRDMFLSHVVFKNCSMYNVTFANVKTSFTSFKGTVLVNSSLLETDIWVWRDMDAWCVLNDTTVRGLTPACRVRPDVASDLTGVIVEERFRAVSRALAAPLALLPWRYRAASVVGVCLCILSPAIYFVVSETALYYLEAAFSCLCTLAQLTLFLHIVESYPANLRCTAHGVLLSFSYAGAMIVTSVYSNLSPHGYIVATLVTAAIAVMGTVFSLKIRESQNNLL